MSHVYPPHELSPPRSTQLGAQMGACWSMRQMLLLPEQSPSEEHDLGSHKVESVLHEVSKKPTAEQSSSAEHGGWQTLPICSLQMSLFGQELPSVGQ